MALSFVSRSIAAARTGALALTVLFAAHSSGYANDAPPPSAEAGLKLIETLCQNCHLAPGATGGQTVTAGIPTLSGIANKPGQTGRAIETVLINPHTPMPDMKLSIPEIADIIAYLDTLRTDQSLPALQPATKPAVKPKSPTPS